MIQIKIEYLESTKANNYANLVKLSIIEDGKDVKCRMSDRVMKHIITKMQDGDIVGYEYNYTDPISITSIWK